MTRGLKQNQARTEEAAQICARDSVTLDLNKTAKAYQADVRALTKALSMTTKRQGVSVDLLNAEVARSLEIQKKAKQSIKDLTELFKASRSLPHFFPQQVSDRCI